MEWVTDVFVGGGTDVARRQLVLAFFPFSAKDRQFRRKSWPAVSFGCVCYLLTVRCLARLTISGGLDALSYKKQPKELLPVFLSEEAYDHRAILPPTYL